MKHLRVLIVDDEPLARERLRRLLAGEPGVEIAGECGSGPEALARLESGPVEVVFLDIDLPGPSGVKVLAGLPEATRPAVIFATAHEQYAREAFDLAAVDYLLKPFDQDRVKLALRRAETWLRARRVAAELAPLEFKVDGRRVFLRAEEIGWVEAADNYVVLHLAAGGRHMVRETMAAIEQRLGAGGFVRVNRSAIVRVAMIQEVRPGAHGDYSLLLRDATEVPLSRSLRGKLDTLFGRATD